MVENWRCFNDLRTEIVYRCTKIAADNRSEAKQVLAPTLKFLAYCPRQLPC